MIKKKALIIGISGQDGFLLSQFLEKKKYQVYGVYKNIKSLKKIKTKKNNKLFKINTLNFLKIKKLIKKVKPDEIYNFSGITDLKTSENNIIENEKSNNFFLLKLFTYFSNNTRIKIFNSLSSELFKKNKKGKKKINKINDFFPETPYAIAKLSSYYYSLYFRKKYNMKIYNGFFFNHDSVYRQKRFIVPQIIEILLKAKKNIYFSPFIIRNILSRKDFGSAKSYVEAAWRIIQNDIPDDYIIGSGKTYSLLNIIKIISKKIKLKIKVIRTNQNYKISSNDKIIIFGKYNKNEPFLIADQKTIKKKTNWKNKISYKKTLDEMILNYKKNLFIEKKIK